MERNWVLYLNSTVDTNRTGTVADSTYSIEWSRVIPPEYRHREFRVRFAFCSSAGAIQTESYIISADFGTNRNTYDQTASTSRQLGLIPFQSIFQSQNVVQSIWYCGTEFNPPVITRYPSLSDLRITLQDQAAPYNVNLTQYVLALSFELI